nr:hypothetical protein [Tanacetum cinerariifolium]
EKLSRRIYLASLGDEIMVVASAPEDTKSLEDKKARVMRLIRKEENQLKGTIHLKR